MCPPQRAVFTAEMALTVGARCSLNPGVGGAAVVAVVTRPRARFGISGEEIS